MQNINDTVDSTFDYNAFMKTQRKKARITAVVLGAATIISLIFLLFAFIQKMEANRARAEADALRVEMESMKKMAYEQMEQAKLFQMKAEEERIKLEKIAMENTRLLEACAKSKR
jgi:hypothetical protein